MISDSTTVLLLDQYSSDKNLGDLLLAFFMSSFCNNNTFKFDYFFRTKPIITRLLIRTNTQFLAAEAGRNAKMGHKRPTGLIKLFVHVAPASYSIFVVLLMAYNMGPLANRTCRLVPQQLLDIYESCFFVCIKSLGCFLVIL